MYVRKQVISRIVLVGAVAAAPMGLAAYVFETWSQGSVSTAVVGTAESSPVLRVAETRGSERPVRSAAPIQVPATPDADSPPLSAQSPAGAPDRTRLGARPRSRPGSSMAAPKAHSAVSPLVLGTLSVAGTAKVHGFDRPRSVANERYAYLGGERIEVLSGEATLTVADQSATFHLCTESITKVRRDGVAAYRVDLEEGAARISLPPGVSADVYTRGRLTARALSSPQRTTVEVSLTWGDSPQANARIVSGSGALIARDDKTVLLSEGQIAQFEPLDQLNRSAPGATRRWPNLPPPLDADRHGAALRCKVAQLVTLLHDTTEAPHDNGSLTRAVLEPPAAPKVSLALPGAPDTFDPNVLPPPAAGPATAAGPVPIIVPAPAGPSAAGAGGGSTIIESAS